MSYRQLARMAPTTLSVHRVVAINLKTHFAKDVLDRNGSARLTWQRKAKTIGRFTCRNGSVSLRSAPPRHGENPTAFPLPIYLVQSDARLLSLYPN
jgi:hypothetical protein